LLGPTQAASMTVSKTSQVTRQDAKGKKFKEANFSCISGQAKVFSVWVSTVYPNKKVTQEQ
jgi:hypothetical protein